MKSLSRPVPVFFILPLLAVLCGCSKSSDVRTETRSPNIIFVYADNLGYGDIEPFGATTIWTPHLI